MKSSISIVLPAYNEGKNVKKTIETIISSLKNHEIEIVLVDDGSTDDTLNIAKNLSKKCPFIRLHRHEQNMGYAEALKTGFEHCKKKFITFIDADLQNDPMDISKLVRYGNMGYDVIVGWRKNRKDVISRLIISKLYNFLVHLLFFLKLPDINGKPKLLRSEVLKKIDIESKEWLIDLELVHKAKKMGFKIIQVPVKHLPRKIGKSKASFKKGLVTIFDLLRYRIRSF